MGSVFAYSLLAGLAPLLSSSIPFITLRNRNVTPSVFHILLCVSAGLLFAVATLELIPESIDLSLRSLNEVKVVGDTTSINNNKKVLSIVEKKDGDGDEAGIFSLSDIDDLEIGKLNENKVHNNDLDGHDDHDDHDDHEEDEKKHKLRTPLYGLGFGFAVLIIVESIFSGTDGGHHSHSHGLPTTTTDDNNNKNDIISDHDEEEEEDCHGHHHHHHINHHDDHDGEEDSHKLLEKNNQSGSSIINNNNNNNSNDDYGNDTPESVTTPNHQIDTDSNNGNTISTSKNRNKNDSNNNSGSSSNNNTIDIKNSSSSSSVVANNGNNGNKSKLTITTFIALSIHSFVDGVVISSAFTSSPHVGARVALAIVIHKIPDGLVLSSIILSQKKFLTSSSSSSSSSPSIIGGNPLFSNPFFYFFLISCMTPLGAFISNFLFGGLSISSGSFVLGFGAGTFLYITSTAILPEILSSLVVKKSTSLISMFLGYLLFIFLDSTFHGAH